MRQLRNYQVQYTDDDGILAFSKYLAAEHNVSGEADRIVVVVNTDPHTIRETTVHLDLAKLGIEYGTHLQITDLISGDVYHVSSDFFVRLDPFHEPAHVFSVKPY